MTNADGSVLFLSCDLQNSTRFKQSVSSRQLADDDWLAPFLAFYRQFPRVLGEIVGADYPDLASRLSLWKAVGDELIFSYRIESASECGDAVSAWLRAMTQFEVEHLLGKTSMTLKGGAFLATVPYPDRRVAIPQVVRSLAASSIDPEKLNEDDLNRPASESECLLDFVGPSIDTGFRVLTLAERRYFVLTAEVASLLAEHSQTREAVASLHFMGTHLLKGVWNGQGYPVFALYRATSDPTPASKILVETIDAVHLVDGEYPAVSAEDVLAVVDAYRHSPDWVGASFTVDDEGVISASQDCLDERARLNSLDDDSEKKEEIEAELGDEDDFEDLDIS
ncbi:hypothetical protein [Gordonia araii]|uniref:hypothetical protein n=1 Tax=Gordonia araii TaxID=263909 RepID=UPI00058B2F41|nr:hypothetical protein [Gordonia araii]NNG95966.1 hypothetical protein [Gordonia araii NBRC 100433]